MDTNDISPEKSQELQLLLQEYAQLCQKPNLTEPEAARLEEILNAASQESVLSFWLDEADHFITHGSHHSAEISIRQMKE